MKDPRDLIESHGLVCERNKAADEFWARDAVHSDAPVLADWSTMIAFATAILAANEAWLDSQTPTLDDLMTQYPAWKMRIESSSSPGLVRAWAERRCAPGHPIGQDGFGTFPSAIRWLAAKLEELTDGK